jgi:hypothetical protein
MFLRGATEMLRMIGAHAFFGTVLYIVLMNR